MTKVRVSSERNDKLFKAKYIEFVSFASYNQSEKPVLCKMYPRIVSFHQKHPNDGSLKNCLGYHSSNFTPGQQEEIIFHKTVSQKKKTRQ